MQKPPGMLSPGGFVLLTSCEAAIIFIFHALNAVGIRTAI